jgi:head-tail adaptor
MPRPSAGRLRHRIAIEAKTGLGTADAYGALEEDWQAIDGYESVPAECDNVSGSEEWTAEQVHGHAAWRVLFRFLPDVTGAHRFKYVDRAGTHYLYPISVVSDVKEIWMTAACTEHLGKDAEPNPST